MSRHHRYAPLLALALLTCLAQALHATPVTSPKTAAAQQPAAGRKPSGKLQAAKPSTRARRPAPAPNGTPFGINAAAESLIAGMNANYLGLPRYDILGNSHMVMSMGGQQQIIDVPFRLAADKPARLRNEIMNPVMPYVTISDGAKTWAYLPMSAQYTEKDAAPLSSSGASSGEIGSALASGTPIQRYLSARDGMIGARIVGETIIMDGGSAVPCVMVDAQYATPDSTRFVLSPNRFWIDPARRLVLRDSLHVAMTGPNGEPVTMTTITSFSRINVGTALPDTLFTFHAPATATKVDAFQQQGMKETVSPLVGKPASDFTLKDLAGRRQTLSALKGKVVLLDFWATWCGPCRRELPTIAKLHKELQAKGLAVVAVNVGEPPAVVSSYLKRNGFSLPVWLDTDTEVSSKYGASSIPTLVVIDKTGNVSALKVGLREEADLRALLEAAGLK